MKVLHVVGARPNFMKIEPVMAEMERFPECFEQLLVHTGQHYDYLMSRAFFEDLQLREPDIHLDVGSGSHAQQSARIMMRFEEVLEAEQPDLVVVVGDVNSTLACALVASKLSTPVAHVEAGLRRPVVGDQGQAAAGGGHQRVLGLLLLGEAAARLQRVGDFLERGLDGLLVARHVLVAAHFRHVQVGPVTAAAEDRQGDAR